MTMTLQQFEHAEATVEEAQPVAITITRDQEQRDLVRRMLCPTATDDELALFMHVCKRTGLDPLTKQVYPIKRWNKQAGRETMAIQTGIDGYRAIAERTGQYAGNDDPVFEYDAEGNMVAAKATIWKVVNGQRFPFTATARWAEYVQTDKSGNPANFWARMPYLMLGKVAEALALRKAFPNDLSGIYTADEMAQADNGQDVAPAKPTAAAPPALPSPEQAAEVDRQRIADFAKLIVDEYGVDAASGLAFVENHIKGKRFIADLAKGVNFAWTRFGDQIRDRKFVDELSVA
jgi:phage recombination protein Bet